MVIIKWTVCILCTFKVSATDIQEANCFEFTVQRTCQIIRWDVYKDENFPV